MILTIHQIAERLGVERQTVNVWRSTRGIMPEPDYTECPTCGIDRPLWKWETIEAWARKTGRLK